ncbi:MAG: radical SAM protein [Candidatus Omnitrophota bacterium]
MCAERNKKRLHAPPRLSRSFSARQISEAIDKNRLLSLSLKLPVGCNLKCRYCYSQRSRSALGYGRFARIMSQAAEMGLRSLSIIGEGEPFMYRDDRTGKDIYALIRDANSLGLNVVVFTNNTLIDERAAEVLYGLDVTIVCKLNSFDPRIQDSLTGVKGSSGKILRGLRCLEQAGFTKKPSRLSIHTVICRSNYAEIPQMWGEFRRRNIIPYFQVLVPPRNQNERYFNGLRVSPEKLRDLFIRLRFIDEEFGFSWDPEHTYPIAALGCSVVKTGCCVGSDGKVQMCGYLAETLGDARRRSLSEIMSSAKVRKIRGYIYNGAQGKHSHFYGCRAVAFNTTGDRFADDPFFRKNSNKL